MGTLSRLERGRVRLLGAGGSATAAVAMVVAVALIAGHAPPAAARPAPDVCRRSAKAAFASCKSEAHTDELLAGGICANDPDPAAQKTCLDDAAATAKDFRQSCEEQKALRKAVCDKLGPAPYTPVVDSAHFPNPTTIDNDLFPLIPGTMFVYEGQTSEGFEHVEFLVTHKTKTILNIDCVEVHDTRKLDNKIAEDTRDWFAQDAAGNVWYFGENTAVLEGGLPVDLAGSWTGGVDGAQPGFVMEANPAIGDFYRQEYFLGEAEDLAEVKSLTANETVQYVPGQCSNDCLETEESSPLAPGDVEHKFYKHGIGNTLTIDFAVDPPERSELVNVVTNVMTE